MTMRTVMGFLYVVKKLFMKKSETAEVRRERPYNFVFTSNIVLVNHVTKHGKAFV